MFSKYASVIFSKASWYSVFSGHTTNQLLQEDEICASVKILYSNVEKWKQIKFGFSKVSLCFTQFRTEDATGDLSYAVKLNHRHLLGSISQNGRPLQKSQMSHREECSHSVYFSQ